MRAGLDAKLENAELRRRMPDALGWVRDSLGYRGGLVCLNSAARFDKWNHAAVR